MRLSVGRLRRRVEFERVAKARRRWVTPGLVLQARPRVDAPGGAPDGAEPSRSLPRVGFTVSRKVGKAVERNRVRRRLRVAVERVMPEHARGGMDFVVVGRREALHRPFDDLVRDLKTALERLGAYRGDGEGGVGNSAASLLAPAERARERSNRWRS